MHYISVSTIICTENCYSVELSSGYYYLSSFDIFLQKPADHSDMPVGVHTSSP